MSEYRDFLESSCDPPVRGFLHRPASPSGDGLVLTHGAGGNVKMAMFVALAEAFAGAGFTVLRCDLPFRQVRPFGPPRPSEAFRDRAGLANALAAMRKIAPRRLFLGGQSYGGRKRACCWLNAEKSRFLDSETDSRANPLLPLGMTILRKQLVSLMACSCCLIPCTHLRDRISNEPSTSLVFTFSPFLCRGRKTRLERSRRSNAPGNWFPQERNFFQWKAPATISGSRERKDGRTCPPPSSRNSSSSLAKIMKVTPG